MVTVCEWTDRIYQNTQPEHIITNVVSGRKMRVQKYNFPDTVVWNPWQEKARDIPDFGDDEFPNMICVESGHVSSPVILLPGTAFEASQILQVICKFYFFKLKFFFLLLNKLAKKLILGNVSRGRTIISRSGYRWVEIIASDFITVRSIGLVSRFWLALYATTATATSTPVSTFSAFSSTLYCTNLHHLLLKSLVSI